MQGDPVPGPLLLAAWCALWRFRLLAYRVADALLQSVLWQAVAGDLYPGSQYFR